MQKQNGCHNKNFNDGYYAQDGMKIIQDADGDTVSVRKMVWIPHRMTTTCQYDKANTDKGCVGCNKKQ